jgi:hypothetical protein
MTKSGNIPMKRVTTEDRKVPYVKKRKRPHVKRTEKEEEDSNHPLTLL